MQFSTSESLWGSVSDVYGTDVYTVAAGVSSMDGLFIL